MTSDRVALLRRWHAGETGLVPARPASACRCGQTMIVAAGRCARCVALERASQGESVRLFEPAPAVLEGQGGLF